MRHCLSLSITLTGLCMGCAEKPEPRIDPSTYDVVITADDDRKVQAIKAVRAATGLGLKDAKDLVESAPATIEENLSRTEAEAMASTLRASALTVEVRAHQGGMATKQHKAP
jgi:large subunit ribosomal protein L7/L12